MRREMNMTMMRMTMKNKRMRRVRRMTMMKDENQPDVVVGPVEVGN